ncbi:hypothetical protein CDD81_1830 [Ophiocordyceps australis]|uniref:Acetyl esterase n=1 Tax=Ophiocordyceps australis TaxID=1399860 RepID=A0A2C5XSV1_9HYPO|nr:hypothetical protein CDD81_1830 [Ophiocordyceps australis]
MLRSIIIAASLVSATCGASCFHMDNLVAFGDSYTDEGRLEYFYTHRSAPPVGSLLPPSDKTASGGYSWGRFVAKTTGAKLYNYAVGGAMCSNALVNRSLDVINGPFPSVLDYEVPAFRQDLGFPQLYPDRRPDNTVYALWIGTNDLGIIGLLGDNQNKDVTLTTFAECVWVVLDQLYQSGARQFVVLNQLPLELAPMYATPGSSGMGNVRYWANKTAYNITEFQFKLAEYTSSVNTLFHYGIPFNLHVKARWPGASFALFDTHSLLRDIMAHPSRYLDAPANITGPFHICLQGCVNSPEPLSSFLWFDELHPSERTQQIIATNFVDVVKGTSKYAYYHHA